jgi:hypothetical protein
MTVRALDENGDIVTSGRQFLSGGSAAEAAQNVNTRLKFFTGEWFLDIQDGTPWFPQVNRFGILGKGGTLSQKEAIIRRRILLAPAVAGMSKFQIDYEPITRQLSVVAGIISTSSESTDLVFTQAAII